MYYNLKNKTMSKKFAVITTQTDDERSWYSTETRETIKVDFLKKLNTGEIQDCLWSPRELFLDTKNDVFDFKSGKALEFGTIDSSGNMGSFSEIFLLEKKQSLIELLKVNGFEIIE